MFGLIVPNVPSTGLFLALSVVRHQNKLSLNYCKRNVSQFCFYATEVCPVNKAHIDSLDFAFGSCFSKIFCVKSRETIAKCMQSFKCQSVKHVGEKRRHKFIQKYFASRSGLCKLFK